MEETFTCCSHTELTILKNAIVLYLAIQECLPWGQAKQSNITLAKNMLIKIETTLAEIEKNWGEKSVGIQGREEDE